MMCVCDKLNWMENGWMDRIEWMWKVDGKWMWMWKVDSGMWRGSGSHTHRRRSDWNSGGGRMAGLTIKVLLQRQKTHFPTL